MEENMTRSDIKSIAEGFGPVVRQYVAEQVEPIRARLEALEAAQPGSVKRALPVYRVPAIRGAVR